jgi:hypothetical protein
MAVSLGTYARTPFLITCVIFGRRMRNGSPGCFAARPTRPHDPQTAVGGRIPRMPSPTSCRACGCLARRLEVLVRRHAAAAHAGNCAASPASLRPDRRRTFVHAGRRARDRRHHDFNPASYPVEAAVRWIEAQAQASQEGKATSFAIEPKQEPGLIGGVGLRDIMRNTCKPNLAFDRSAVVGARLRPTTVAGYASMTWDSTGTRHMRIRPGRMPESRVSAGGSAWEFVRN